MEAYNPKLYNQFDDGQSNKVFNKEIKMFDTTCVDPDSWNTENFVSDCQEVNEENKIFLEKSLNTLQTIMNDDNNTLNANPPVIESFSTLQDTIDYNNELSEKQKVQKDNIQKVQDKEQLLEKTDALLKTSIERNNFKRKLIYSLVAVIFLLFVLSIGFYVHYVRDFKVPQN